MSKSRYSKTKAAGAMVGLSRYGKPFRPRETAAVAENRATRRAKRY